MSAPRLAAAQDMPSIFSAPDLPAATAAPAPSSAPQTSPSAQAAIPPAPMPMPVKKPQIAAVNHPAPAAHRHVATVEEKRKFAALMKKLAPVRREAEHRATVHRVAAHEPKLPPGTVVVPPPGYYQPGPYARLVYGGPSRGPYGWGGYSRSYPYDLYP